MQLSKAEVEHIAKLARLALTPKEVEKFSKELTDILNYVEKLQELDTHGIEPTAQVTGLLNTPRDDVPHPSLLGDALLKASPLPVSDRQIKVFNVMEES